MAVFKIHYWPALTTLWIAITFIISYIISVKHEDVYPFFPYISDTGAYPPASSVFGQLLNMGAVIMGITLYLRYKQINYTLYDTSWPRRLNVWMFWLGNLMCFGISMVANFQANTKGGPHIVLVMHFIGAITAFGVGIPYLILQTVVTHICLDSNSPYRPGKSTFYLRSFLALLYVTLFSSTFIFTGLANKKFSGDRTWWTNEYDGYGLHLGSTISEWTMVLVFALYMLSATNEFKTLKYKGISIHSRLPSAVAVIST